MKYSFLLPLLIVSNSQSMNLLPERLNDLFDKLQQPVDSNFQGSADDYREIHLQQIEALLSSPDAVSYNLPNFTLNVSCQCFTINRLLFGSNNKSWTYCYNAYKQRTKSTKVHTISCKRLIHCDSCANNIYSQER